MDCPICYNLKSALVAAQMEFGFSQAQLESLDPRNDPVTYERVRRLASDAGLEVVLTRAELEAHQREH